MKRKHFAVSIGRTAVGKLGLFCTQRYQAQQLAMIAADDPARLDAAGFGSDTGFGSELTMIAQKDKA